MRPETASILIIVLSFLPRAFPGPNTINGNDLKAEIDALAAGVHAANAKAQGLAKDETLDPEARTVVVPKCLEFYTDAIASLDNINKALGTNDGELMHDSFNSIDSLASLCEDAFDAAQLPSPLMEENRVIGVAAIDCIGKAFRSVMPPSPSPSPPSPSPLPPSSLPLPSAPSLRHRGSAFPPSPASSPASPQRTLGPLDPIDLTTVCSMTRDMSHCISAVQSVTAGPLKTTNAAAVLRLTVNATIVTARAAIAAAHALSRAHRDKPGIQDILNIVCAHKYRRAIRKLHEAEEAITQGDKHKLRKSLSVAGHFMACERAFGDASLPTKMADYNDDLKGLAVINLGIARVFWPDPMFDQEYNFVLRDV